MRGIVEGFYGPPWSPDARLEVIEFVARRSMNAYVYAPKSDPKHRDQWRDPYDQHELEHFRELAACTRAHGMRFGFALSPGLDIAYADNADRATVVDKLAPLLDAGVNWIVLALDDIPTRPGLGREQADLAHWVLGALHERSDEVKLTLVPTEYVGSEPSPYRHDLGVGLPAEVDVMWTGPTVCSPTIRATDARAWVDSIGGHATIVWDNFPVNDGSMERSLHLGPYIGREPGLTDVVEGVLCNPMIQPRASKLALACAAAFLRDPAGYDPHAAWVDAVDSTGGVRATQLSELASACADSPLVPAVFTKARQRIAALADATEGPERKVAFDAVNDHIRGVRSAARAFAEATDDALAQELGPWLEPARVETGAGIAALKLLEHIDGPTADAEQAMQLAFGMVFAWSHARSQHDRVVFGPRFAVYPAVVQLAGGRPGLDVDLTIVEDENAIDVLCRLALARYGEWTAQLSETPD